MRVLSLFDGIACGYEALIRAGIKVDAYYASEIDKYAIQVAKKNHPDIIEIGDVTQIKGEDYKDVDIIIGGSPCQGFSMAGKMLNFDDPRSKLFFEFVRLVKEIQPKYFLLENVKMKKEFQDVISSYMGVEPIEINSALVSAQNRKRLYWTNIPGITQPQDKGLLLRDVLQDNVDEKYYLSEKMKSFFIANDKKQRERGNGFRFNVSEGEKKASSVTTRAGGRMDDNFIADRNTIQTSDSLGTITNDLRIRKLTPIECERLQTLPDNYTEGVSDTQRYKALGNGRTVDVITHIFRFIK